MEKSIESMWKEGFLNSNALIAPKVNDIYNKKSIHIIEKFERMFKNNIRGIVMGASILFVGSYFVGALLGGGIIIVLFLYVAYTAYKELKSLERIDKAQSSYAFLKSFKEWIEKSIERYGRMFRVVYPVFILTFYFGMWFSDSFDGMREKVAEHSDLFFGLHVYTTLVVIIAAITMSIFSKTIHRMDVKTLYGRILKKLDLTLAEMEELKD